MGVNWSTHTILFCDVWSCGQPARFYKYPMYSLRGERLLRCGLHTDGTFKPLSLRLWPQDAP